MTDIPSGLKDWAHLGGPAQVLAAVRQRAVNGAATESGTLRIELSADRRREVGLLLGKPWELSGQPVRLQTLANALAPHGMSVREFIEGLDGTELVNLRALRAEQRTAANLAAREESAAVRAVLAAAGIASHAIDIWMSDQGWPRPGSGELVTLAEQVATVWHELPPEGQPPIPLAQLAARVGDHNAHTLDSTKLLGRAAVRLIAAAHDLPRPTRGGRVWRQAWASAGVKCDWVSSRVLVLDLPPAGDSPAARWCAAAPGEPLWLTLRSLPTQWALTSTAPTVFVCENVTVVEAAADRLGTACPPMVCTDGYPANAALDVIGGLAEAGCTFRIRADFDTEGLTIAEQIHSIAHGAQGWRYDCETYARHLHLDPCPDGDSGDTFAQLRRLYQHHKIAVHEESILDDLLSDLNGEA